jgi:lipoprotein-anchoring transpeptidase ErfK/SrfK
MPRLSFKHLGLVLSAAASVFLLLGPAASAAQRQGDPKQVAGVPGASAKQSFPRSYKLTDDRLGHWAVVMKRVAAHAQPWATSRVLTMLDVATSDGTQNLVLILEGKDVTPTKTWYRVRLAILPNNTTGWVPASALGELNSVNTHLYIDRSKLTATLKRNGVTVFKSIIGIGRSYWPTPAGEYYIRDRLNGFDNPVYGPIAFGTSARSPTLTDWPGGGFVGVHGTNEPQILPGAVSHGCIRMPNESILKLARLMSVGTPLTIR